MPDILKEFKYAKGALMKKKSLQIIFISFSILFTCTISGKTTQKTIKLVAPDKTGGMPIMEVFSKRSSSRSFTDKALSDRILSNLLWAAYGINRSESGKRTAPSALNRQEIDVYVVLKDGAYIYNAKDHKLELIIDKDISNMTGKQGFVSDAAVNLVYVADMDKSAGDNAEEKMMYAGAAAGFIGQNVYLFCASEKLNTVIRAYIDRDILGKALNLKPNQKIILAQTVGYPGK